MRLNLTNGSSKEIKQKSKFIWTSLMPKNARTVESALFAEWSDNRDFFFTNVFVY